LDFLSDWAALALHGVFTVGVLELVSHALAGVWDVGNKAHLVNRATIVRLELKVKNSIAWLISWNGVDEVVECGGSLTLVFQYN